jgi:hypothetical protein
MYEVLWKYMKTPARSSPTQPIREKVFPKIDKLAASRLEESGLIAERMGQPSIAFDRYVKAREFDPDRYWLQRYINRVGIFYIPRNEGMLRHMTAIPLPELKCGVKYVGWFTTPNESGEATWNEMFGRFIARENTTTSNDPSLPEGKRGVPYIDERQAFAGWKGFVPYIRVDEIYSSGSR